MGGILTGNEILRQVKQGRIAIDPFNEETIGPVSYNIRTGLTVKMYKLALEGSVRDSNGKLVPYLNPKDPATLETVEREIPKDGMIMYPEHGYLVPTLEYISSPYYEPILTGRSSTGRMFVSAHQEAGFGDIGFRGIWTLQVTVAYPTMLFPNDAIAQVYFITPEGDTTRQYNGKYQDSIGAIESRAYRDHI